MTAQDVTLFRSTGAILVESIWWDARERELIWVDITAGTLHRSPLDGAVDGSDDRVSALPPPVSAVQPRTGGGYIAALRDRVVSLDANADIEATLAVVPHSHAGIRCNEGKVDPFGRFVVGGMDVTTGDPDAGLYVVDESGIRILRGGFGVANGIEWSDAGDVIYVTDTSTKTVYRADYNDRGELGELEPFLRGRSSDGLALDVDGHFWNGIYGDGAVVRWSPDGEVVAELSVPASNVTSVAFGGDDRATLFIGTARENLTEEELGQHPLSGGIFRVRPGATGRPVNTFGVRTIEKEE